MEHFLEDQRDAFVTHDHLFDFKTTLPPRRGDNWQVGAFPWHQKSLTPETPEMSALPSKDSPRPTVMI